MSIRSKYEFELPQTKKPDNNKGGCLTFGFLMKWLAALGLGAGTVTMVVIALSAVIAFILILVSVCLLCGFMGAVLEMLSEMPVR